MTPSNSNWKRGREVEGIGLENRRSERARGFESHRFLVLVTLFGGTQMKFSKRPVEVEAYRTERPERIQTLEGTRGPSTHRKF